MKGVVLAMIIGVFGSLAYGQNLKTFSANGLFGYKRGNVVVIPAKFAYAADFSYGRAAVLLDNKWGYIDSKGILVIPNNLELAESFHAPYVFFHENKLIGLMDTMGKRVVPAVCDEIYDNGNAWYLKRGKLRGAYIAEYDAYIEPKYQSIDFYKHFILAEIAENRYDVYSRAGKFLGSNNMHRPVLAYSYDSEYFDLSDSESTFLVDETGKQVTSGYQTIHREPADITLRAEDGSSEYFSSIYLLHLPAPADDVMADENGDIYSNRFHLLFGQTYLNDAVYSNYGRPGSDFLVKKDGVWNKFDDGKLVPAKYIGAEQFNAYWLLNLADGSIDVAAIGYQEDTLFIAHFNKAVIPTVERVNEYYNPEYDSPETYVDRTNFPIVEVEDEKGRFAIYNIDERSYLTSFGPSHYSVEFLNNAVTFSGAKRIISVLKNEAGVLAYNVNNKQSKFEFSSFEFIYGHGILLEAESGSSYFLPFRKDTIIELPANTQISASSTFSNMESYVDPETGNEFWNESANSFTFDFLVLTDGTEWPKYGFMNSDYGIVKLPVYDRIYGSSDQGMYIQNYELIVTELNGLYGSYDLRRNIEIKPQYKTKLEFEFSSDQYFPYMRPDSMDYYLSSTGKKFHAQYNDGYPFKLKNKAGYISYNDFNPDVETDTLIPAVYASLYPVYDVPYHIASNQAKKKGLLSLIGDTLLPFEYNDIQWNEDYYSNYDLSGSWFETAKDKKKGVFNAMLSKAIPAIFEDIEMQEFDLQNNSAVFRVEADGKCGLYNGKLTCTIPCEQDGIDLFTGDGSLIAVVQKGNKIGMFSDQPGYFDLSDSTRWYDYIVGQIGYVKTADGYNAYNMWSRSKPEFVKEITFLDPDSLEYEIFEEDGLLGLRNSQSKKVLAKPTMRYIRMVDDFSYIKFENGISYYGSLYDKKAKYRMYQW